MHKCWVCHMFFQKVCVWRVSFLWACLVTHNKDRKSPDQWLRGATSSVSIVITALWLACSRWGSFDAKRMFPSAMGRCCSTRSSVQFLMYVEIVNLHPQGVCNTNRTLRWFHGHLWCFDTIFNLTRKALMWKRNKSRRFFLLLPSAGMCSLCFVGLTLSAHSSHCISCSEMSGWSRLWIMLSGWTFSFSDGDQLIWWKIVKEQVWCHWCISNESYGMDADGLAGYLPQLLSHCVHLTN